MLADRAAELAQACAVTAARLSELEEMPVGPGLICGLAALRAAPIDADGAVRRSVLWAKAESWMHAEQMVSTVDAVHGVGHLPGASEMERLAAVAADLATATHRNENCVTHEVALTMQVLEDMPTAWIALSLGQIRLEHVTALSNATANCDSSLVQAIDAQLIPYAVSYGWTPATLTRHIRKAVIALDPDGATKRANAAKARADIRYYPEPDETATLQAHGDAVALRQVKDTIDSRAAQMRRDGDERSVGLRRLAALTEFVLGPDHPDTQPAGTPPAHLPEPDATAEPAATEPEQPTQTDSGRAARLARVRRLQEQARRRGEALIRLDFSTLLGADDRPGELDGYGPISAATARAISKDASLRRLLTDPVSGDAIDLGRDRYQVSKVLREFLEARDQTCQFPSCHRSARWCDCDHRIDFHDDGETSRHNLHLLCRKHHNFKTKKFWRVDLNPDGSETWRGPTGRVYRTIRHQIPIDQLVPPDDPDPPDDIDPAILDADPDPPRADDPLPEPPIISLEEYLEYCDELDRAVFLAADKFFDRWQAFLRAYETEPADCCVD